MSPSWPSPPARAARAARGSRQIPRIAGGELIRPSTRLVLSSLKERAGVKRDFGLRFCGGAGFAGHGGMASRRLSSTGTVAVAGAYTTVRSAGKKTLYPNGPWCLPPRSPPAAVGISDPAPALPPGNALPQRNLAPPARGLPAHGQSLHRPGCPTSRTRPASPASRLRPGPGARPQQHQCGTAVA